LDLHCNSQHDYADYAYLCKSQYKKAICFWFLEKEEPVKLVLDYYWVLLVQYGTDSFRSCLASQSHQPAQGNTHMAVCQNLVPLVNIKIAGKWMFIPLKMVLIGIDPYPYPFWDDSWYIIHDSPQ